MKITTKQLKQIIKEELNNALNEMREPPEGEKIWALMLKDEASFFQGVELFDNLKGMGVLDPEKEEHIQNVINYYDAIKKYLSLTAERRSLKPPGTPLSAMDRDLKPRWKEVKKEISAAKDDIYKFRDKIRQRFVRAINIYTGVLF